MVIRYPVDVYKKIYNYMYGYVPEKHTPDFMGRTGNIDGINWIICHDKWSYQDITTAFVTAAMFGHLNVVHFLDKYITFYDRNYAFRMACGRGQLEIVRFLVESGADIHDDTDIGIFYAYLNWHHNVVNYLRQRGSRLFI